MKKVKITVLKKHFYEDLAEAYLTGGAAAGACPLLEEGDVFLYKGARKCRRGFARGPG